MISQKLKQEKLGDLLVKSGLVTEEDLGICLKIQKKTKMQLGKIFVEEGFVKEADIVRAISEQMGIPYADLTAVVPDTKAFEAIPMGFAEKFLLLPIYMDKKTITMVMANPFDKQVIDEISYITGKEVKVSIATHVEIRKAIQQFYRKHRPRKLGEILIESGFITKENLNSGLKIQKTSNRVLGEILVDNGYVKEEGIALAFSKQMGLPYTDLASAEPAVDALRLLPQSIATKYCVVPLSLDRRFITVAMANPLNLDAINDIRRITGKNVQITVSTMTTINKMITQSYQFSDAFAKMGGKVEVIDSLKDEVFHTSEDAIKKTESQPIVLIVNTMITEAVKLNASDIHLEMGPTSLVVRIRVDGLLRVINYLPKWVQWPVISRIKIMSKLNIAERRMPQDGRIKVKVEKKEVDLRVSTIPSQHGEKVVIRLLDPTTAILNIKDMGLLDTDYKKLAGIIEKPQGIVLVTGPTGSGKTSTLYAMINHIKDTTKNIVTLEDPIEYDLEGVNQIGITDRLPFANALRAVLRQDPDVILIGELRDSETANIAVQASITGHLVLTTLHTNTAVAAINRLKNLGVKPYMIASSLNGIVGQRLVRKVCTDCKQPYEPTEEDLMKLGLSYNPTEKFEAYKGRGCSFCNKTGYKGRSGVFEILTVDSKMRNLIINEALEDQIALAARNAGMRYMIEDSIDKVKHGDISMLDIPRVVTAEENVEETPLILCQRCGEGISEDFHVCPFCGLAQQNRCTKCDRMLKPEWKFCPYCSIVIEPSLFQENQ